MALALALTCCTFSKFRGRHSMSHSSLTLQVQQLKIRCAWHVHGMGGHGVDWERFGHGMAMAWERRGHDLGMVWRSLGMDMERHGHSMGTARLGKINKERD